MKHTLFALSLALLPLAAAETNTLHPSPEARERAAERAAEFACIALSRPLAGGGHCTVAGGGSVIRSELYIAREYPEAGLGTLVPVPVNRVTCALNSPEACDLPADWYDDKYKPLWKEDALIPADKVRELWYAAIECLEVPLSWFCDEAGDNLVIITGHAANYNYYEMYLYQWDEARQAFVRRGVYSFASRVLDLIPTRTEFLPEGMRVCGQLATEKGNTVEYSHLFRYAEGNAVVRFPDGENYRELIEL